MHTQRECKPPKRQVVEKTMNLSGKRMSMQGTLNRDETGERKSFFPAPVFCSTKKKGAKIYEDPCYFDKQSAG